MIDITGTAIILGIDALSVYLQLRNIHNAWMAFSAGRATKKRIKI